MADTQEITTLWSELKRLDSETTIINKEKERIIGWLTYYKNRVESLEDEINRRKEFPERYPFAAGAGTIDDIIKETNSFNEEITNLEKTIADFDQPVEDIEESRQQLLFIVADKFGLETLKQMRTAVGKEMAKHNRLQHEAYEAQKERYENCKRTFGFTPDDRVFIAHHKNLNQTHIDKWISMCDQRTMLCELITALDPTDEDYGLDEEED